MNKADVATRSSPAIPGWATCLWTILGILCLGAGLSLLFVDDDLARWLHRQQLSWPWHPWSLGFRQLGKAWALLWLLFLWLGVTRQSRPVLCAVLAMVLTLPLVWSLKLMAGRARPGEALAQTQVIPDAKPRQGHSFPSGDAATVFAASAAFVGFVRWPWLCVFFTGALGVGMLRVVILAHYLSDVCLGAAIGLLAAAMARFLHRRLDRQVAWLDEQIWVFPCVLCAVPLVVGFWEGPEHVLLFFRTFGAAAIGVALVYRLCFRRRHPQ